jgi:glycosyltransferase involved in cell wall biosynthesis
MSAQNVILIVCNRVPYPLKDGGALAMYAMIKGWHQQGKKVYLLAMNTSRHRIGEEEIPSLFREIAGFEMVDINTDIHFMPVLGNLVFSTKPQHADRFYSTRFSNRLVAAIKKIKPDIIQLESIYLHEYAPVIREHSRALLVQRLHNVEEEVWKRLAAETTSTVKKLYLQNLAKRIARYERTVWAESDALLAISNTDANYILRSGCATPVLSIPYGIDIASENLHTGSTQQWTAYHIGAMDWRPNVEAMEWMQESIAPEIIRQSPGFTFHFAGRNMPEQFKACTGKEFFCAGEVDNAEDFIADKKILLVPVRSGSGIRVKTLEAMAAGKLVISTGVGIQGIDALDKIHFLKADTPQEFATALHWCTQHPEHAERIISNAFDLLQENHNQRKLMQRLAGFVEKLP